MADKRILTLLSSTENDKLFLGLQLAAKSGESGLLPALARNITSTESDVSSLALSTAVSISRSHLLTAPRSMDREAFFAAVAIIKKFQPDFVRQLCDRLEELDNGVVVDTLMTLRHFIGTDKAQEILKRHGKTPDSRIRATLVRHIGPIAGQRAPESIARFLDDPDNRVRANALEALEKLNNRLFLRVVQRFKADPIARIRANAAKALVAFGDLTFVSVLESMITQVDKLPMRVSAVWTIGEIGLAAKDAYPLLRLVSADRTPELRKQLRIVLEKAGMIPEVDFLRHILKDELKEQIKAGIVNKGDTRLEKVRKPNYTLCGIYGMLTVEKLLPIKFAFQEMENQQELKVIVDCTCLEFIDSSGASFLANLTKRFNGKGGFFRLFGCNKRITELFQVTGLDYLLSLHPDEESAANV